MSWQEATKHVFEWANFYLTVPIGVTGFGFAFYQIGQAKTAAENAETAAEAAKTAAESARGQFKTTSVAVLLPQLRTVEEAVDRAILDQSLTLLAHLLQDWRWHASTCREYLDDAVEAEAAAMKDIQASVIAATNLKHKFPGFDAQTDWAKETSRMRKTMAEVTSNLGALSAQQTVKEPK
ncbi:hypothetical protein [Mycolicibacter virginiensis]|uniref:hypothetical protein n=1 Tax=Mycolicibacter virginiensis TaxID=1795032 RepID=UPI001F03CEC1|nr:hypothetical protein [Mycolicibacter virginiensis]ULP48615.1 hypothetical protein MJO54_05760 [Mycolicibacter virginiensis]